jgi:uncharacterized membrane protein
MTASAQAADQTPALTHAIERYIRTIIHMRMKAASERSREERAADSITAFSGRMLFIYINAAFFAGWFLLNTGRFGLRPFDPYPYGLLTMIVSLEAIFLALFVLASQNRMTRQADKRSHLDLQIDLLAEREMTAVLQLLQDIARHLQVQTSVTPEQLSDLMKTTDVRGLMTRMEELTEATAPAGKVGSDPPAEAPHAPAP